MKVEKVAGELKDKWKAHLYFKKMRLSTLQKSQILTGALGSYTVEVLSEAALHTYPSMREARGQGRGDRGRPSYPASQRPHKKFHPRRPFGGRGKRPWRAKEIHIKEIDDADENPEELDEWEEEWPEDYDGDEEDPEEEEEEEIEVPQKSEDGSEQSRCLVHKSHEAETRG